MGAPGGGVDGRLSLLELLDDGDEALVLGPVELETNATVESAGAGGGVERAGVADGERHEVAERRVDGGLDDGDGESGVHGLRAKRGGEGIGSSARVTPSRSD